MVDKIFEAKPGLWGFSVNLHELFRRLKGVPVSDDIVSSENHVTIVARRFRDLFVGHELKLQHAADIFPSEFGITLDKLTSDEKILSVLTPKVLDWTARYFGVQREWLDGSSNQIYPYKSYTRHPNRIIDDVVELMRDSEFLEAFVFIDSEDHDLTKDRQSTNGRIGFLMRGMIKQLNSETYLYRYLVCGEEWPLWRDYLESLLVMGRLLFRHVDLSIPIMTVTTQELKDYWSLAKFPRVFISPPYQREFHLEDFGLYEGESAKARGDIYTLNIPEYIQRLDLDDYFKSKLKESGFASSLN
ncbi:MAG: hypothetical protein K9M54_02810 [Kiritimatiellales bacterium]|nr:hypothetical protein [Kiritimatiellales bacterium]MCF7863721.1 hypothetical protein [Kiritimatiellales bacterium]